MINCARILTGVLLAGLTVYFGIGSVVTDGVDRLGCFVVAVGAIAGLIVTSRNRAAGETIAKNILVCVGLALFLHSPDLNISAFSRSTLWKWCYGIPYWLSFPLFCYLAWLINWKNPPAETLDRRVRYGFTFFLPLFALWYFMFVGWFIGHRMPPR